MGVIIWLRTIEGKTLLKSNSFACDPTSPRLYLLLKF